MPIPITQELLTIFRKINTENKTLSEWNEFGFDDMYQTDNFNGGFDHIEQEFCFSYYIDNKDEYWFQVSLKEIQQILNGEPALILARESGSKI